MELPFNVIKVCIEEIITLNFFLTQEMNEIAEKCVAVVDGKWSITASKLVTLVKLHNQSDKQTLDIAEVRKQTKI